MATYVLPKFPTKCNVWSNHAAGNVFIAYHPGSPRIALLKCELIGRAGWWYDSGYNSVWTANVPLTAQLIYFPKGSDIRGNMNTTTFSDTVELPAGSGRYYVVQDLIPTALDFANEFLAVTAVLCEYPTPF